MKKEIAGVSINVETMVDVLRKAGKESRVSDRVKLANEHGIDPLRILATSGNLSQKNRVKPKIGVKARGGKRTKYGAPEMPGLLGETSGAHTGEVSVNVRSVAQSLWERWRNGGGRKAKDAYRAFCYQNDLIALSAEGGIHHAR